MRNYAWGTNIPFLGVKIRPFTDDVPDDNSDVPVVVYGSCGMIRAARKTSLARGIFDNEEGFKLETWKGKYGDALLNHDAISSSLQGFFDEHMLIGNKFFVRSDDDEKTIIGHITDYDTFTKDMLGRGMNPEQRIIVSPCKAIYREYRCFVVDGKVVSGSSYGGQGNKLDNNYYASDFTLEDAVRFANQMAALYTPHRVFVMDVCDSEDGPKIVELNGFNSSGFYDTDIPKIMDAVNNTLQH